MEFNGMIPVYYDAEFTGLHRNTTLVSVGLCMADGAHFYGEFTDYDKSQVDPWLQEHVLDNLLMKDMPSGTAMIEPEIEGKIKGCASMKVMCKGTHYEIGDALKVWLKGQWRRLGSKNKLQFYIDCYAYDWVLMNDLICDDGHALYLPEYVYYIPMDLSSILQMGGIDPDISREEFAGDLLKPIQEMSIFHSDNGPMKHNSLWDAYVAQACFNQIRS